MVLALNQQRGDFSSLLKPFGIMCIQYTHLPRIPYTSSHNFLLKIRRIKRPTNSSEIK
jgi:hypothetical protein